MSQRIEDYGALVIVVAPLARRYPTRWLALLLTFGMMLVCMLLGDVGMPARG